MQLKPKGWLLDGFPRTLSQAHGLTTLLDQVKQPLDFVFFLDVSEDVILSRLKDRWVHPASGRVYNTNYNAPRVAGKDDVTGEPLERRADDTEETVRLRLDKFRQTTRPLLDYYRQRHCLRVIDSPTSDIGYASIRSILEEFNSS